MADLNELSVEELEQLYQSTLDDSLVNTVNDSAIPLVDRSVEDVEALYEKKLRTEEFNALSAEDTTTYFKNAAKLGLTDTIAFGTALQEQFMIKPWAHLLEGIFFGKDGVKKYQEKQNDMQSSLKTFYNSDDYRQMLLSGRNGDIKRELQKISDIGGSAGITFENLLSSVEVPEIPFTENATYWNDFLNSAMTHIEGAAKLTGADPHMQPSQEGFLGSQFAEYAVGMGFRFGTDPITYIPGGASVKAATIPSMAPSVIKEIAAGTSSHFLKRFTTAFGIGNASVLGGEAGFRVEKEITEGEGSGSTGRLVGSLAGGFLSLPFAAGIRYSGKYLGEAWKRRTFNKKNPDSAIQEYVTGGVKNIYKLMEGEIKPEQLKELVAEFKKVGSSIDVENIPLLVMAADSPTVQRELTKLMKTDPEFRNLVQEEVLKLGLAIDRRADNIFGTRYAPVPLAHIPQQLRDQGDRLIKLRMELDKKIETLSLNYVPGTTSTQIGEAIKAIVLKREDAARKEMKPIYKKIIEDADTAGAIMNEEAVNIIYQFVKENNLQDLFGRGTPLDNMIKAHMAPKKVVTKNALGQKLSETTVMPELTFTQVDSLKRAINAFERMPLSRTELRQLQQLKKVINEQRETIPGDFNKRLIAADTLFYEKVGIPYGAESIVQINSKKYAEEIYPIIFKNKTSLTQFLDVASTTTLGAAEGYKIARNAYLMKAYEQIIVDGVIHPFRAKALLKKDREILGLMPDVRKMIEDSITDQSSLILRKASIEKEAKQFDSDIAKHFLIQSGLSPNYPALSADLIKGNMSIWQKIEKDLAKVDANTSRIVRDNIKREYVSQVFESKDGGIRFMLDPKNRDMIKALFSENPKYLETLHNLSLLSDNLKKIDLVALSPAAALKEVDPVARIVPGVTTQYGASQIRDRVSSIQMKAIRILTHINQAKLQSRQDKAVQDLLLHKDITKLDVWGKSYSWKVDSTKALTRLKNVMAELIPQYIFTSLKSDLVQEVNYEKEKIMIGE